MNLLEERSVWISLVAGAVLTVTSATVTAQTFGGFELSNLRVPRDKIRAGGPGKDGIPAIVNPKFVSGRRVDFLRDDDIVVGYTTGNQARAYPLRILVWHEIVNDTIGNRPIIVTYCPLCASAIVFDRRAGGRTLTFGVSGLLYESDVLMYDRQTNSLWSQLEMSAVAGSMSGAKLNWLNSEQMTWRAWRKKFPKTEVLSTSTGYRRDYRRVPYTQYKSSPNTMFPVTTHRRDLPQKTLVAGIIVNGVAKAYPLGKPTVNLYRPLHDTVGGRAIEIAYNERADHVSVKYANGGVSIPSVTVYWFAWQAFYPKTKLFRAVKP